MLIKDKRPDVKCYDAQHELKQALDLRTCDPIISLGIYKCIAFLGAAAKHGKKIKIRSWEDIIPFQGENKTS
jgi:hypothetical protein